MPVADVSDLWESRLPMGMPMGKRKNFSIGSRKIRRKIRRRSHRKSHRKNFHRNFRRSPELRRFFAGKIAGKLIRRHFHRNFLPEKSKSGRISELSGGFPMISDFRGFLSESFRKSHRQAEIWLPLAGNRNSTGFSAANTGILNYDRNIK